MPVSNTLLVLKLAIIRELNASRSQFGEVMILPVVLDELKVDTSYPGTNQINQAIEEGW